MGLFSRISRSADLMKGMAERVGADLEAVTLANPETEVARYRSAVLSCSTCREQDACQKLQQGCTELDEAPAYCVNRDMLAAIAHS